MQQSVQLSSAQFIVFSNNGVDTTQGTAAQMINKTLLSKVVSK
jgi:hypothetical protein